MHGSNSVNFDVWKNRMCNHGSVIVVRKSCIRVVPRPSSAFEKFVKLVVIGHETIKKKRRIEEVERFVLKDESRAVAGICSRDGSKVPTKTWDDGERSDEAARGGA